MVVHRVGHGFAPLQRVDGNALLIEIELGRQHPDFLCVVAGEFVVGLVDHLHQVDLFAHLLGRPGGLQRRGFVVGLGGPDGAVVIPVERPQAVAARVEFRQVQLAQAVRQRHADVPTGLVARQIGLGPEQRHPFLHPGVGIGRVRIKQGTRKTVQQITHGLGFTQTGQWVKHQPGRAHVRKLPAGQRLHPGVFQHLDDRLLRAVERLQRQRRLREHQVRRAVVDHGAVDLGTGHHVLLGRGIALGAVVVVGVGNVNTEALDVGFEPDAVFVVAGGGAQEKVSTPHGTQVNVQAALHIHKQGALALLLQHRQRVAAVQGKVLCLPLKIRLVSLRPPHHPAAQTAQRELGQETLEVLQHRTQAAWHLCQHDGQHVQVVAKEFLIAQAGGRQRRGTHDQREHRSRSLGRHAEQEVDDVGQHVFADGARHLGHGLDEADHQFFATPQVVQRQRALEVVVQPARGKHPGGFAPGRAQHVLRAVWQIGQQLRVVVEVDRHGTGGWQ